MFKKYFYKILKQCYVLYSIPSSVTVLFCLHFSEKCHQDFDISMWIQENSIFVTYKICIWQFEKRLRESVNIIFLIFENFGERRYGWCSYVVIYTSIQLSKLYVRAKVV